MTAHNLIASAVEVPQLFHNTSHDVQCPISHGRSVRIEIARRDPAAVILADQEVQLGLPAWGISPNPQDAATHNSLREKNLRLHHSPVVSSFNGG